MTKKIKPATGEELMSRLRADPEWAARDKAREEATETLAAQLAADQAPLLADLRESGVDVKSVRLLNPQLDPRVEVWVPILFAHFNREYDPRVRDAIARAIGKGKLKSSWSKVVALYRAETQPWTKQGLAAALERLASKEHMPEIYDLLRDRSLGSSRVILLAILSARISQPGVHHMLLELRDDAELSKQIDLILRAYDKRRRKSLH